MNNVKLQSQIVFGIALMSVITISISGMEMVYADKCSANDVTEHCYTGFYRTGFQDGHKVSVTIPNLTVPNTCGVGTTEFTVLPNWLFLNSMGTDWIEVGVGEGKIAGNCYNEVIYTFTNVDGGTGGTGFGTHGTLTVGNTYALSIDDSATAKSWKIKKDTTTLRTLVTSYNTGFGSVGIEQTHNSTSSTPLTHLTNISYYNSGWNTWNSGSATAVTPNDTPLSSIICTADHHIHVKSGTAASC